MKIFYTLTHDSMGFISPVCGTVKYLKQVINGVINFVNEMRYSWLGSETTLVR